MLSVYKHIISRFEEKSNDELKDLYGEISKWSFHEDLLYGYNHKENVNNQFLKELSSEVSALYTMDGMENNRYQQYNMMDDLTNCLLRVISKRFIND